MNDYIRQITTNGICKFCYQNNKLSCYGDYHRCMHDYDDNNILSYFIEVGGNIRITKCRLVTTELNPTNFRILYKSKQYLYEEFFNYSIHYKNNSYKDVNYYDNSKIIDINIVSIILKSNSIIDCFEVLKSLMLFS